MRGGIRSMGRAVLIGAVALIAGGCSDDASTTATGVGGQGGNAGQGGAGGQGGEAREAGGSKHGRLRFG